MYVQRRNEFDSAVPFFVDDLDEHAHRKQDAAIRDNAIRIDNVHMASSLVMEDYEGKSAWLTLRVRDRAELAVEKRLLTAKIMTFVPCDADRVEIRRGRKWIIPKSPIMSGYVQVRCALDARALYGLLSVKEVIEIVGGAANPWLTSDRDMNHFISMYDNGALLKLVPNLGLKVGDDVRVLVGPWVGMFGEIVQMPKINKRGSMRLDVVVSLRISGVETRFSMPLAFVKKV